MRVASTHLTARAGVARVQSIFAQEMGWLFREQPISDFGVDAQVEIVRDGHPTGRLIAIQIKSGDSYFREEHETGFVVRGEAKWLDYWLNHSLPVIIVLCDLGTGLCLWEAVSETKITRTAKGWRIEVPRSKSLGNGFAPILEELAKGPKYLQHLRQLEKQQSWDEELKEYPVRLPRLQSLMDHHGPLSARSTAGLEVLVHLDHEYDYLTLISAYSSPDPLQAADLTLLTAGLSNIEVVNHDNWPTEVVRVWLSIIKKQDGTNRPPLEIKEEKIEGDRRIPGRSRRTFNLDFTAVFEGAPQKDWRDRVRLCVRTIGLGEVRIKLKSYFSDEAGSVAR